MGLAYILLAILLTGTAAAHETRTGWVYPVHCCGNNDCGEIDAARVRVTPDGYVIDGVHIVPFRDALKSPDSQYHACDVRTYVRCFFAPPGLM
jgi:hypothetical protein